jgi:hypothetical protein
MAFYLKVKDSKVQATNNNRRGFVPVLRSPSFDKAHSDGAHSCQLVDSLKAVVHRLREQRCKLLVVENFQVAT